MQSVLDLFGWGGHEQGTQKIDDLEVEGSPSLQWGGSLAAADNFVLAHARPVDADTPSTADVKQDDAKEAEYGDWGHLQFCTAQKGANIPIPDRLSSISIVSTACTSSVIASTSVRRSGSTDFFYERDRPDAVDHDEEACFSPLRKRAILFDDAGGAEDLPAGSGDLPDEGKNTYKAPPEEVELLAELPQAVELQGAAAAEDEVLALAEEPELSTTTSTSTPDSGSTTSAASISMRHLPEELESGILGYLDPRSLAAYELTGRDGRALSLEHWTSQCPTLRRFYNHMKEKWPSRTNPSTFLVARATGGARTRGAGGGDVLYHCRLIRGVKKGLAGRGFEVSFERNYAAHQKHIKLAALVLRYAEWSLVRGRFVDREAQRRLKSHRFQRWLSAQRADDLEPAIREYRQHAMGWNNNNDNWDAAAGAAPTALEH